MTYRPSELFVEIGNNCIDLTPSYTATLEDIAAQTITALRQHYSRQTLQSVIADIVEDAANGPRA